MSERRNADLDPCPENHEIFRFCVKKGKAKKKKFSFNLCDVIKELGPGNKNWFENATAKKIQQKKQKPEDNSVPLCTPKDKIHSHQLYRSNSSSSESSENKFYSKIQRLLTSQTSTPSQTESWQAPVLGASPDVVSGSAPLCRQVDIRESLGVDMNDSMLSWTSSMATPTLMDSTYKDTQSPVSKQQKGLPRVLFSPGPSQTDEELHALDNTSEDNTDDDEPTAVPSKVRDSNQTVGSLISPDITVFQNINHHHHEVFNRDSELSEHFSKTHSEEKFNSKSQLSVNFQKNSFKESVIVDASVDEESSIPLFSQDLYMDDDIEGNQVEIASTEIKSSNQYTVQGSNTSTNPGDGREKGVSDALSDFFDPPSSAVGRRRCAPRKGKKRKLLDDSLNLDTCSENEMSTSPDQRSKKLKTDLLCSENRKDEQYKTELVKIEVEEKQENKPPFESEDTEGKADSPSSGISRSKCSASLSEEDIGLEKCSTPNNAQKIIKSILSNKKTTNEGSGVKSNKKVRFCLEEQSTLKRNLTQLDDEDYVSPEVFDQSLSEDNVQSGTGLGHYCRIDTLAIPKKNSLQNDTDTFAIPKKDTLQNDISKNLDLQKSLRKDSDLEMCEDLFSQVSPTALNEMCSVVSSVDKRSSTEEQNLETGPSKTRTDVTDKTKQNHDFKTEDEPVLLKNVDKKNVTVSVLKTDEDHKATFSLHKEKDPVKGIVSSNSCPSNAWRSSISQKSKPKRFLYPSTNQISKSCPKSVYGFAEQTEKNMRLTMNTKDSNSKDTPQTGVLVQESATKSNSGEKDVGKNQLEQPTVHRGMKRNIGFESFSSLANHGKLDSETDRSDVLPEESESKPKTLNKELVQTGNITVKPKREQLGSEDFGLQIKCEADVQSSKGNTTLTHTEKDMLQLDSGQVIPDKSGEHNANYMESESTTPNIEPLSADREMFQPGTLFAENQIKSEISINCSVHDDGDEVKPVSIPINNIDKKCPGFTSASGKTMTLSDLGLHKAKQLFVSVDSDTGIGDASSLCFTDVNILEEDKASTAIEKVQYKHEMKLPRRTCTISQGTLISPGKTTSVLSTPKFNIAGSNQPTAKESVPGIGVDFEDMLEDILKSRSSPEVSRHTPLKGSKGFHKGQDKNSDLKMSSFKTAVSVMSDSKNDPNLNAKDNARGPVSFGAECKPEDFQNREGRFNSNHTVSIHKGFTTAGGTHLQISEASLKKASVILEDTHTNYPPTSRESPEGINEVKNNETLKNNVDHNMLGHLSRKEWTSEFDKEDQLLANINEITCDTSLNNFSKFDNVTVQHHRLVCKAQTTSEKSRDSDTKVIETTSSVNMVATTGTHPGHSSLTGKGLEIRSNCHLIRGLTDKMSDKEMGESRSATESGSDGEKVQLNRPGRSSRLSVGKPVLRNNSTSGETQQCFSDSSLEKHMSLLSETAKKITAVSDKVVNDGGVLSSTNREKHKVTDSDFKKFLLKEDTDKGMDSILDSNNSNRADGVSGFSTAAAKKRTLIDSSLKEEVLLMYDVSNDETDIQKDTTDGDYSNTDKLVGINTAGGFGGFSTAGGKKLKVSNSSLKKAVSLVAGVEEDATDISKKSDVRDFSTDFESEFSGVRSAERKSEVFSNANDFGGFSTAGGKKLKLSDASLKKARSLVADFEEGVADVSNKGRGGASKFESIADVSERESTEFSGGCGFGGFSTAGGKKLILSDASMKKGRSLVADFEESMADISNKTKSGTSESESPADVGSERESTEFSSADGFGGFSTAGGKKLKLSDASLKKARSLVASVDEGMVDMSDKGRVGATEFESTSDGRSKREEATSFGSADGFGGFSTAGGKKLHLSETSMKKALSVISDIDGEDNRSSHDILKNSYNASDGSQTAGNKQLQLSKASIKIGMKDSLSSDSNSKSEVIEKGRGKPGHINLDEKDCTSEILDILNLSSKSGSSVPKDKSLQPNNSRKGSSRFPPGANIPKGFRPFKPPKITKKLQTEKTNSKECVEVSSKVVETTKNPVIDESPSILMQGTCCGDLQDKAMKEQVKLQTTNFSEVKGSSKDIQQKVQEEKVQTRLITVEDSSKDKEATIDSVIPDNGRDITPVLKVEKFDQDIEPSIMDELFSEELESSQHFSPGSGKVLRSQRYRPTPGGGDQGRDILPSEEYEQFLDIEDMALCKMTEIKCEQPSYNEVVINQTSDNTNDNNTTQSMDIEDKSLKPTQLQDDDYIPIKKHYSPVQQTGFSGFESAPGEQLWVSEEAPKIAKKNSDDLSVESQKENLEQSTEDNPGKEMKNSGFKSASGTEIPISEVALSKAKQVMIADSVVSNNSPNIKDEPVENYVDYEGVRSTPENESIKTEPSEFSDGNHRTKAPRFVNKSPDQQPLVFRGFQSASGKKVHVSEEALMKAKQSISEWCPEANEESQPKKPETIQTPSPSHFPECAGFQSASGKKVGVSEEGLAKARQNFKDWSSEVIDSSTLGVGGIDGKGDKSRVTLLDEGLCEDVSPSGDKSKVKEEGEWTVPELNSFHEKVGKTKLAFGGKGGKDSTSLHVQTDHLSLQEVMNSQYDFSQDDSNSEAEGVVKKEDNFILFVTEKTKLPCTLDSIQAETSGKHTVSSDLNYSFKSASGKQVTVSESSIQHARKTMEDVSSPSQSASENKENISEIAHEQARQTTDVVSLPFQKTSMENMSVSEIAAEDAGKTMIEVKTSPFQSASGKQVNISKSALEHAKQTLEKDGSFTFQSSEIKLNLSENALQQTREMSEKVGISPFQSASGKKVNISENALEQARQTLEEIMSSPFQSTSDKTVNLSQSAVRHAKENEEVAENSPFQSASGKKVNICDSALQHAKKTLDDINNCPFQSASGNKYAVSSEALEQARKTLSDNTLTITSVEPKNTSEGSYLQPSRKPSYSAESSPFQTATGAKITISESSLQHVRKNKEDLKNSYHDADEVRDSSLSCDVNSCSVQQTESTKSDKMPRIKYQMIKEVDNVQQFSANPYDKNFITPSKQKQHISKFSKNDGGPSDTKPHQQSTGISPCVSSRTDRQVFIEGMDHSIDEFCQPDDFLEEMEVTPKRRKVEEKAVGSRSGMVKPMKSVPEAFTKDRQGTNCSLRACYSKSTPAQGSVPRLSTDGSKSQLPVKSSFLTPYKKSDSSTSGTGTNSDTCSTVNQASRKPIPKFIPKCLSVHQPDLLKSQTTARPTSGKESPCEKQQKPKGNEKADNVNIAKLVEESRKHQAELLKVKEKAKVIPDPGRLYTVKTGNRRLRMRDVIKLQTRCDDKAQYNQRPRFGDVRAATAVQYKFYLPDFYTNFQGHVYVGDGAYLVPNDQLYAGKEELFRAFSTLPGVDCQLISDVWFYNHYRWLVWKLAAYEVTSPLNFAGRALTPEVVMLQMKYRYDREIDNCQRSALKKIMERDDTASKRMVLCVSGINQQTQPRQTDVTSKQVTRGETSKQASSADKMEPQTCVELTDGWYCITARLDIPLTDLVKKQKIGVGHKLCVSGAELVGSQEACTPLEAPASLMLKLNANSTRPAPWDARLGYQRDPRPLCISLSGLYGEGGPVGCLDVVLARKYPQMYMEKLSEGGCVFRTGQAEDRFQHQHQKHRQEQMEKLYAKLQNEFELEDAEEKRISKKKWTQKEVELLQTGHELYEAYSTSRQPDMIEEYLSNRQRELLMERRRQVQDEKHQKLHAEFQKTWQTTSERTVIPLMKMKVVGCSRKDMDSKASTTVTVWRPTQDVMELTEGTRYRIFGMNASSSKSRYKQFDVQLTATRQTRFMPVSIDENLLDMIYEPREVLSVRDIKCRQPLYGEADFVGMVVSVSTVDFAESGRHQEIVYAVDANGGYLGIKFWGGLKSFSVEDVLSEGRLFCASNLMDKSAYRSSVLPLLEASLECSVFTQASQYPAQRKALDKLKSVSTDTHGFLEAAKEGLSTLKQQKNENTKKFTPEKTCNEDIVDPLDSVLKTPVEGSSASSSSTPSSAEEGGTVKQSHAAYQARMSRLLNFGSPTPLSPLVSKTSHSVSKDFKPPVLRRKSLGPNH